MSKVDPYAHRRASKAPEKVTIESPENPEQPLTMTFSYIDPIRVSVAIEKARDLYQQWGGEDAEGNPKLCMVAGEPFQVSMEYLSYCTSIEAMQDAAPEDQAYDWIEVMGFARYMPETFWNIVRASAKFLPDERNPFRIGPSSTKSRSQPSSTSNTQSSSSDKTSLTEGSTTS